MPEDIVLLYTEFLKKYHVAPVIGHRVFFYHSPDSRSYSYITQNDLKSYPEKEFYFNNAYIEDSKYNVLINRSDSKSISIGFIEWLRSNMFRYIDKKIDYNELFELYVEEIY